MNFHICSCFIPFFCRTCLFFKYSMKFFFHTRKFCRKDTKNLLQSNQHKLNHIKACTEFYRLIILRVMIQPIFSWSYNLCMFVSGENEICCITGNNIVCRASISKFYYYKLLHAVLRLSPRY